MQRRHTKPLSPDWEATSSRINEDISNPGKSGDIRNPHSERDKLKAGLRQKSSYSSSKFNQNDDAISLYRYTDEDNPSCLHFSKLNLNYGFSIFLIFSSILAIDSAHCPTKHIFSNTPTTGVIESPGYPMPYASDLDCLFNITTAPSNVLQIAFLAFDLADRNPKSDQCLEAYFLVIVVDRQGKEHLGERICGSNVPEPIHTMQSSLQIQFVTTLVSGNHKGFRIQYRMLSEAAILEPPSFINDDFPPCGGHSNPLQLTGEIQSPGYPETYPSNATCNWLIRVEPRQRIYIRIVHFNLSATIAECNRASLIVFDGYRHEMVDDEKKYSPTGANDPSEARFCGSQAYYAEEGMLSYMSTANRIIVRMVTHDKPRRSDDDIDHGVQIGFKIVWTAVESLISEGGIDEEEEGISGEDECDEFVCKGGQICMEEAQGICASRSRLCIHKSLVCNGVHNCADGDFSDEAHCYSREIIIISAIAFSFVLLTICICVCCDQYRKKQKLRRMIRERREENGTAKMQTRNSERTAARRPMLENKR